MQQQETNETSKKETEMGHKGPVKTTYKTQNQVEKRHTQSSGWNNVVKGGKKRKKTPTTATHQLTSHPRNAFLETTLFNR